eukprot:TRINITY_DN1514_c0_g1_i1.p1 TRINITY_DN1514_c0_g1~~TRINITY_DN1514_c0_g1_i1.p1  ORF type:complete len:1260 (+),score=465.04 TRINITY_DN1514_c0_g1_i1:108-3887(+)
MASGLSPRSKPKHHDAMSKRMGSFKTAPAAKLPGLSIGDVQDGFDGHLDHALEQQDRQKQVEKALEEEQVKERVDRLDHRVWRDPAKLGRIINERDDDFKETDFDVETIRKDINGTDGILRDIRPSYSDSSPQDSHYLWWSTESEEVRDFRRLIARSGTRDEDRWRAEHPNVALSLADAQRFFPQVPTVGVAASTDKLAAKPPRMVCHYNTGAGRIETVEWAQVPVQLTADEFIARLHAAYQAKGVEDIAAPGKFTVVKVLQTRGFMFGPTPLLDFLHIRRALSSNADAAPELRFGLKTFDAHLVLSRASQLLPHYKLRNVKEADGAPAGQEERVVLGVVVNYGEQKLETYVKNVSWKASQVIQMLRDSFLRERKLVIPKREGEVLVLKVLGKADYIWGRTALIDFAYIRRCYQAKSPAKLSLQAVDSARIDETKLISYSYENMLKSDCASCCGRAGADLPLEHKDIALDSNRSHFCHELSLWDMDVDTEIEVRALSNIAITAEMVERIREKCKSDQGLSHVKVKVVGQLCHGTQELAESAATTLRWLRFDGGDPSEAPLLHTVWGAQHGALRFQIKLQNLPRDARLCLTAMVPSEDESVSEPLLCLGWVNVQLFDHRDFLRRGSQTLSLWADNEPANPIGVVSTPNTTDRENSLCITLTWPKFSRPVRFPHGCVPKFMRRALDAKHGEQMDEFYGGKSVMNVVNQVRTVRSVVEKDPLYQLKPTEKVLLWEFRNDLTDNPNALSKFLQAVDWASPAAVQDCLHLLHHPDHNARWRPPKPGCELEALELLDARYANGRVREYAIHILDSLSDSALSECILQLVQVLKYEPYHYSALARFLLRRSVNNPQLIGHTVFWHLKAEMSNPKVRERHGLLIEELVLRLPIRMRRRFGKQDALIEVLLKVAVGVKKCTMAERNTFVRKELDENFVKILGRGDGGTTTFDLPLDPRMECSGLNLHKCKTMDSKKVPLWLVFHNADPLGPPIYVMFKAGDDLRQDLLTLQIIAMMDSIWRAQGLDLHMSPYGCVACDDGVGMIEVVTNSETIANITEKAGGANCVFIAEPMLNWLRQQHCNKDEESARACMWNFLYSCAGYCVATYILGIKDRHNDNIMLKQDGTLFHIDFGHFLGNFKKKDFAGVSIKRETTPFVFTPMYAHVLGGEKSHVYKHFTNVACAAYNIVRRHSHIIISLFVLMLSTGIPELQCAEDLEHLREVFLIDQGQWVSDEKATKMYQGLIEESRCNRLVLLNDYIHIMAHPKGN